MINLTSIFELRDLRAEQVVEIRVGEGNQVWVNIDEQCVLRVVGAPDVAIIDDRLNVLADVPTPVAAKNATVGP